jgi:nitroreductase
MFADAVGSAAAAPSLHNTQPWRFRYDRSTDTVQVRADRSRVLKIADPAGWGMRLALGAATYNLTLAFAVAGQPMEVAWLPSNTDPDLHALLTPGPDRPATGEQERLYRAIPRRHSNRSPFRPEPVPLHARAEILRAAREELAWVELVTGVAPVAAVAEITQAAQQALDRDPGYVAELRTWTRHGESSDGVPVWTSGHTTAPQDLFPQRSFGDRPRPQGRDYETDPLVAVLGTAGDLAVDHLRAGYALQRVLLTITDLGLSASMFSQPIEVPSAREQLRLALGRFGTPQMVLRIGYGEPMPRSARRPAQDVIDG